MNLPVPTAIVEIAWKDDNLIIQELHGLLMSARYDKLHGVPVHLWENLKVPDAIRAQFTNTVVDQEAFPEAELGAELVPLSGHGMGDRTRVRAFDLAVDEERVLALVRQVRNASG